MTDDDIDWSTVGFVFSHGQMRLGIRCESQAHLDEVNAIYSVEEFSRMMGTDGVERRMRFAGMEFDPVAPFPKPATMIWIKA
jgi:hypothetical protein